MKKSFPVLRVMVLGALLGVLLPLQALALPALSGSMPVVRSFGGTIENDAFAEIGGCVNRRTAFRLIQAIGQSQCSDGVLRPYDLSLKTGWMFGCGLDFFQQEKESVDPKKGIGLWIPHRFSMNTKKPNTFQYFGRSRTTGERFMVSPASDDLSTNYFVVSEEWGKKVREDWMKVRNKIMEELKKEPRFKDFPKISLELRREFIKLLWERVAQELPKALTPEQLALDKKFDNFLERLNKVLNKPQEGDYTYTTLSPGVTLPTLVTGQNLEVLTKEGSLNLALEKTCQEGTKGICLCCVMGYRAAQIAAGLWKDGKFHAQDVKIETGWNSHGIQELFTETMGVPEENFHLGISGQGVTDPKKLTLSDAWLRFTSLSSGQEVLLRGTEELLPPAFLELRKIVKSGKADEATKKKLRAIKKGQIQKALALPFYGGFEVRSYKAGALDRGVAHNVLHLLDTSETKRKLTMASLGISHTMKPEILFSQVMGFRVAQILANREDDKTLSLKDLRITVGPEAHLQDFWVNTLGMDQSQVNVDSTMDAEEPYTIKGTTPKGSSFSFQETPDLGRQDYMKMYTYALAIEPDEAEEAQAVRSSSRSKTALLEIPLALSGRAHDHHTGWDLAHHITEESMESLRDRMTTAPFVGYFSQQGGGDSGSGGCTVGYPSLLSILLGIPLVFFGMKK